jgi:tricorn protease
VEVKLDAMRVTVDPPAEAREMFEQAWRLDRDLFWDPKMNGVDWRAVHDAYARLVPLVGSHEDMIYLLGEMQGELSSSHMFLGGGDRGDPRPAVHTALLGVDFVLDAEERSIQIRAGLSRRPQPSALPGPARRPGAGCARRRLSPRHRRSDAGGAGRSIQPALGKQGSISLTIARSATGPTRTIVIDPTDDEGEIRKLDWIDSNRAMVDRLSGGKVGYIYLSDFEELGSEDFIRQFYPQTDKQALGDRCSRQPGRLHQPMGAGPAAASARRQLHQPRRCGDGAARRRRATGADGRHRYLLDVRWRSVSVFLPVMGHG